MNPVYLATARLLTQIAPVVFESGVFALKGGTAINLFLREMPRLSVDLDLVFIDHRIPRAEALAAINAALRMAKRELIKRRLRVHAVSAADMGETKLLVQRDNLVVKVEVNTVIRGTVRQPQTMALGSAARDALMADLELPLLSPEDIYGGKLVAAMDRQHPRDLFDVMELFAHGGITPEIRRAFVVYLASHNRTIHEVLFPTAKDIRLAYEGSFTGMTTAPVTLDVLLKTRERLFRELPASLDANERQFLLTLTRVEPDWPLLGIPDTMPHGGFGNLIALPLQKGPREQDNSVFVDDSLVPLADQWAFLASVRKIGRTQVEGITQEAERRGRTLGVRLPPQDDGDDEPWTAPPSRRRREPPITGALPQSVELVLANQIYIAKDGLHPGIRNRLIRVAAFQNPDFYRTQAMRLSTYGKPRVIACAEDHPHHLGLPRGCLDEVCQTLTDLHVRPLVRDERNPGRPVGLSFHGELRPEQQAAARAMLAHETGVLAATTAFGKTVIAAWLIAQRGVNTLVLVHRRQLLDQWIERLATFLDIPVTSIGRIGGGRTRPTGILDVAVIQSLVRKGVVDDLVADYGHLIADECHHLSAHSFELVARQAKARFVLGLSATVARKDGHHPIIFMQCGPIRHRVSAKAQAAVRPFEHYVLVQPTTFQSTKGPETDKRVQFQSLYQELIDDDDRCGRICEDVVEAVNNGRSPLVLTERNDHLDRLEDGLIGSVRHLVVLRGGIGKKQRQAVTERLAAIPRDEARVILATGKYIGEGFDDPRLDSLFLTLPVSWRGTIAQYAGRLHRLSDGKREVRIYDYADLNVPMLARMFDRRCRGYEAVGYTILLPASAIPGWPADVVLPSDPVWKHDYAGSVRRLVRDGVDAPLAGLFVHVARTVSPDAAGADRARSATEAFLYRRLETLADTRGRFDVNVALPIPFDGMGQLEVDLLCADARVAVELDGTQHLADPTAYRRDRRKDRLLQEHGYLVLRFLAEDVGKDLDLVLDALLRALSHRTSTP